MSDVDQYAAEAAAIRNRIAESVETLGERLSPSRLVQDAKEEAKRALFGVRDDGLKAVRGVRDEAARMLDSVHDRGADVIGDVECFARENPLAAGAAAAFVGILLVHNRPRTRRSTKDYSYYDDGDTYTATASRPVSRTRKLVGGVRETVTDARDRLGERIGAAADKVSGTVSDATDRARAGVSSARARLSETAEHTSDKLSARLNGARDAAAEAAERASRAARHAVRATAGAIQDEPEAAVAVAAVIGVALALAVEGSSSGEDDMGAYNGGVGGVMPTPEGLSPSTY